MQVELKIKEILQQEISNDIKADHICGLMRWERSKVLDALGQTNGHSVDDRNRFLDKFWPKSNNRRRE